MFPLATAQKFVTIAFSNKSGLVPYEHQRVVRMLRNDRKVRFHSAAMSREAVKPRSLAEAG